MKTKKIPKKVIDPIIESLKYLDPVNNGEFIENVERLEENGQFIKSEDLMLTIEELECVKQFFLSKNKKLKDKKDKKDKNNG